MHIMIQRFIFLSPLTTILAVGACTDTEQARIGALGDPARITCYSGGHLVLDDFSTGKVHNGDNSDGYEFKSRTTGRLQQASGDCQVDYGATMPDGWKATLPGLAVDARLGFEKAAPATTDAG